MDRTAALLRKAEGRGWQIHDTRAIPYGRTARLARGGGEAVLNTYFGKKGFRVVVAGKRADELRSDLSLEDASKTSPRTKPGRATHRDPFGCGTPRVGGDESGKGDWFGPLVVAVVAADDRAIDGLLKLGVTDSKKLGDPQILRMAGAIDRMDIGVVRSLAPCDYNEAYAETPNINVVLSSLYAAALRELFAARSEPPRVVLIDQFTPRLARLRGQLRLPAGVTLRTEVKGEADPTVAAASVLARAGFVEGLKALSQEHGTKLPAGAGSPVLRAGREIARTMGPKVFPGIAKMHFATTRQVLG